MTRFLLTCLLLVVTASSVAQTSFACQYIASGGLDWESGAWKATQFKNRSPFFLGVRSDRSLDENQVAKLFKSNRANCVGQQLVTCSASTGDGIELGMVLYFSVVNARGAVATLLGAVPKDEASEKDSLVVAPFICQKI